MKYIEELSIKCGIWKGYGHAERMWEPMQHLHNTREILDGQIAQSGSNAQSSKAPGPKTDGDKWDKGHNTDHQDKIESQ